MKVQLHVVKFLTMRTNKIELFEDSDDMRRLAIFDTRLLKQTGMECHKN